MNTNLILEAVGFAVVSLGIATVVATVVARTGHRILFGVWK